MVKLRHRWRRFRATRPRHYRVWCQPGGCGAVHRIRESVPSRIDWYTGKPLHPIVNCPLLGRHVYGTWLAPGETVWNPRHWRTR